MPERLIYIVRHAIAEDHSASGRDRDRALTDEGRDKMRRAVRGLETLETSIDVLASSPLVRAVQTADLLAERFSAAKRDVWEELSPGVDEETLTRRVESLTTARAVMVVGHEPDLGEMLAYWLTGRRAGFYTHFRKGAVACLRGGMLPPQGRATLEWLLTARQLGRMGDNERSSTSL